MLLYWDTVWIDLDSNIRRTPVKMKMLVVCVAAACLFVGLYLGCHGKGSKPEANKPAVVAPEKVESMKSANQTKTGKGKEVAKDKGIRNEETRKALQQLGFNPDQTFEVRAEVGGQ